LRSQPIKGLVNAAAMARMTIAEAMTNIMWAKISAIEDIKASGNWMYAAKLPGEGAKMWDACLALRDGLMSLGVGIDGGKDSLSMAAKVGDEIVKVRLARLPNRFDAPPLTLPFRSLARRPPESSP
jgi:phosphoribosylformylglycinamidine synthase